MSAAGNMTSETETRGGTGCFISNLIPVLTLLVIGYPLAPATIRTMLVGWILMGVAITRSILGHRFHVTGSAVTTGTAPVHAMDCGRYR
jgi:hypothetical protein